VNPVPFGYRSAGQPHNQLQPFSELNF
jgi:hypothetical protein